MKRPDSTTISDLLTLGETVLSTLLGAQHEAREKLHDKRDVIIRKLDLVTREEFDAAFAMIKKARTIQSDLEKRITALEKKMNLSSPQKRKTKKQFAVKK